MAATWAFQFKVSLNIYRVHTVLLGYQVYSRTFGDYALLSLPNNCGRDLGDWQTKRWRTYYIHGFCFF